MFRRKRQRHRKLTIDQLERRELKAADISFDSGELHVEGTDWNDQIYVDEVQLTGYSPYWFNRETGDWGGGPYEYTAVRARVLDRYTGAERAEATINAEYVDRLLIEAEGGNDYVRNLTDLPMEAHGGSGADEIIGTEAVDEIFGNSGDDLLVGRGGNDEIYGGADDDEIYGDYRSTYVYDYIHGNDKLYGGSGDDKIVGSHGDDELYGDSGDDILYGGSGDDHHDGGRGSDYLMGGPDDDYLDGGSDNEYDRIRGHDGRDTLVGGGNDYLSGGVGSDKYYYLAWDFIEDDDVDYDDDPGFYVGYGWGLQPHSHWSSGEWAGYSYFDEYFINVYSGF